MSRLFAALTLFFFGFAGAQTYPQKPITLVVPFTAGAANDVLARTLGAEMRDTLGVVVVENKPGANGSIAAEYVKRATADGHTLLVVNDSYLILAAMSAGLPYDMLRDFDAVVHASGLPFFLVINDEAIPVRTLKEFVEHVRARPGKLGYATPGNGTPHHLSSEMLKLAAALDFIHVPYKGMAIALPDLVAGRVQFSITGLPAVAAQLKGGKLRVLATVGRARSAVLPEVPTLAESGSKSLDLSAWQGVMAPAKTPAALVQRFAAEIARVMNGADMKAALAAQGAYPIASNPEQYAAFFADQMERFKKTVDDLGLKLE